MTWPWQRIKPSDSIVPCKCGSTLPAAPVVTLYNAVKRSFWLWTWYEKIEAGGVMACQECGAMYAFGPYGRFDRGTSVFPQAIKPTREPGAVPPRGEPPQDLRPIPKERP